LPWPDFSGAEMEKAMDGYAQRERRFSQTSQQAQAVAH
jgi:undecaprenyl pyrophosphate synthase